MKLHGKGDRRGFALLVALAALVIIGGLIVGAFFASTQEFRIGRNTVLQSRAMTSAEYGLNMVIRSNVWESQWNSDPMPGTLLMDEDFTTDDGSGGTLRVTYLDHDNYLVVSEGLAGTTLGAQGRKRLGGFVRLRKPDFNFLGAVTTKGDLKVTGSVQIHGDDTTPDNWDPDECPPGSSMPGLAVGPSTTPSVSCLSKGCVTGDPLIVQPAAAEDPDTYNKFGDVTYAELAAMANITISGGKTLNSMGPQWGTDKDGNNYCLTGNLHPNNWGDPERLDSRKSCQGYFPIIHVTGDLHLSGGTGQGILLVDGDLTASGGVNFTGPVIVKGALSVTGNGSGARFLGGVMAENVYLDDNKFAGNAVVSYSSCAINKAIGGSATPMFDGMRGWIEMY